jgi:hypothetical protein
MFVKIVLDGKRAKFGGSAIKMNFLAVAPHLEAACQLTGALAFRASRWACPGIRFTALRPTDGKVGHHATPIFSWANRSLEITCFLHTISRTSEHSGNQSRWSRRERTTVVTRRVSISNLDDIDCSTAILTDNSLQAAAMSSPSVAPTVRDALPRTRPSSGSPSATWLSLRLSVRTSRRHNLAQSGLLDSTTPPTLRSAHR